MEKELVNNRLELVRPEGFRVMDHEELKQAYGIDYDCMWGMRDEERHIILSVFWKVSNKLISKLGTAKLVADESQKAMRRRYRKAGYHSNGLFQTEVAGNKAWGFSYGYTPDGPAQSCETVVVKDGTCCYTVLYHTRKECAQANRALYEEILASATLR